MQKFVLLLLVVLPLTLPAAGQKAQPPKPHAQKAAEPKGPTLEQRIMQIASRPLMQHASFGIEVYDQSEQKTLVASNQEKLYTAGSTTKVLTEGSALALLGPDYRFHTRVFHTGSVTPDGTLDGDLILVASGDPNLSGRVQINDTLDYTASDHSYAGVSDAVPVIGEPLRVFKELASEVLMSGIWRIRGRVIIDASMFPSNQIEPATRSTISPILLNDNVVDVMTVSANEPDGPVAITLSPNVGYLKVINRVKTGKPDSDATLQFTSDVAEADGSHTVVLEGSVPAGREKTLAVYKVKDPVLYATLAFREALHWASIDLEEPQEGSERKVEPNRAFICEHVSPPFKEEVKLTLKVSQNLHAATTPYLLGSILGHGSADAAQRGFALERRFLAQAALQPEMVSQLDGEGGVGSSFSPHFIVRYLDFLSHQSYGQIFHDALPILGRDGTLTEVMTDSPAAGHVHCKTGSYVVANSLNGTVLLLGKGLVGYIDAANGHHLIFAAYANQLPLRDMDEVAEIGNYLAEMAAIAYQYAPGAPIPVPKAKAPTAQTKTPAKAQPAKSQAASKPQSPKAQSKAHSKAKEQRTQKPAKPSTKTKPFSNPAGKKAQPAQKSSGHTSSQGSHKPPAHTSQPSHPQQ